MNGGASALALATGSDQPTVSMQLPLGDPFHFVIACKDCIRLTSSMQLYEKLQHTDECECTENLLLLKPVSADGSTFIPGQNRSANQSFTRLPADVSKVGRKGWILVRPRPQTTHLLKHNNLCESVTLKCICHNGGMDRSFTLCILSSYLLYSSLYWEKITFGWPGLQIILNLSHCFV